MKIHHLIFKHFRHLFLAFSNQFFLAVICLPFLRFVYLSVHPSVGRSFPILDVFGCYEFTSPAQSPQSLLNICKKEESSCLVFQFEFYRISAIQISSIRFFLSRATRLYTRFVGPSVRPSHFTFFWFLRSVASLLLPK